MSQSSNPLKLFFFPDMSISSELASVIARSHYTRAPLGFGENGTLASWICSQQIEFRMALLSINGHAGMMCFEPETFPLCIPLTFLQCHLDYFWYLSKSSRCYYHYHDVHSTRVQLFISKVLATVLFSTCLTELWDL